MENVANIIGLFGVGGVMLAYGMMAAERWAVTSPTYLWVNLSGTNAILFSLIFAWNWPGFVLNIIWAFITIRSILKLRKQRAATHG